MPAATSSASREVLAARILHSYLDGRHLPPFVPGEPAGMAGGIAAARLAPDLLATLAHLYGVKSWTPETFERAILRGAFAAWRNGSEVVRSHGALHVVAPTCPVEEQAQRDPRVCTACRAMQAELAYRALGPETRVTFDHVIARGDATCETRIAPVKP